VPLLFCSRKADDDGFRVWNRREEALYSVEVGPNPKSTRRFFRIRRKIGMHAITSRALGFLILFAVTSLFACADTAAIGKGGPLVVENDAIRLEVDRQRETLLRLCDKIRRVDLVSPPELP